VLTLGEGAYARVIRAYRTASESLIQDDWFADACDATRSRAALVAVYVNLERIRDRLSEMVAGRPTDVARAMGLEQFERGLWSVGFEERAMFVLARYGWENRDRDVAYADPRRFDPQHVGVVPDKASAYTVLTLPCEWTELVDQFVAGFLAGQSPQRAERLRSAWNEMEKAVRLNIRRDLLDQLGRRVVVHNYPRHPLGWPIACTVMVEIKPARSRMVRRSVDAFIARWNARWQERRQDRSRKWMGWQRTQDGYWVLHTGIEWLSVGVTERYVIIGWSPEVIRQNVRHLADLAHRAADAKPAGSPESPED
jgi:hypothetical protein